jgi:rhamnosyltransferase
MPASVSVVIPVLNAAGYLPALIPALFNQRPRPPDEVILVDSKSTDDTVSMAQQWAGVRVIPIEKFSHGGSRNLGAREAKGEIVALMSQDARPRDDQWLARLVQPFADPKVAATYSRQVPYPDANPMECYFLRNRFPAGPPVRRMAPEGEPLTLEKVFFSNVSAAVRRDQLLRYPFDETLIMSEDQQLARDLIRAGYAVEYAPESVVLHSHNYTLPVVFRRYFDSVYSLTLIFPRHDMGTSANMGLRYLAGEAGHILRHHPAHLPRYALYTVMKTAGTVAGHFAPRMPRWLLRRLSLHRYHWED